MNHKEFLTAVGVIRKGDEWKAYHRKWSSNILTVMLAMSHETAKCAVVSPSTLTVT
jgi:hypothetical protein